MSSNYVDILEELVNVCSSVGIICCRNLANVSSKSLLVCHRLEAQRRKSKNGTIVDDFVGFLGHLM